MLRICIVCCFVLLCVKSFAQQSISFLPVLNDEPIELEKKYFIKNDSLEIHKLKFYISNIQFLQDSVLVYELEKKYFLIDLEDEKSLEISFDSKEKINYNYLKFNFGIDSLTNVSGAFGGDLDPTNGMYWTWQSGYINFKLEGKSNVCPARKNKFQFHLGGYQFPNNALQSLELNVLTQKYILVKLELDKFFNQINLAENYKMMRPCPEAVILSKMVSNLFQISR